VAPALDDGRYAGRKPSPTERINAKPFSKPPSEKSSKKMPPTPRCSLRCFKKKYSSHHVLKRGYLSSPKGASASRQTEWKCTASSAKP
jgi:hypothetical protein